MRYALPARYLFHILYPAPGIRPGCGLRVQQRSVAVVVLCTLTSVVERKPLGWPCTPPAASRHRPAFPVTLGFSSQTSDAPSRGLELSRFWSRGGLPGTRFSSSSTRHMMRLSVCPVP